MPKKKKVLTGTEARDALLRGANFLADTVKLTLGRDGKNAVIGPHVPVKVTNDGYRIARELMLEDELEHLGLTALREATSKTNEQAGDGTTTSIVLAQAILATLLKFREDKETFAASRRSARALLAQVEKEKNEVLEKLVKMAKPIKSREHLISVTKVSVENDELAEMIGGTQWDLGPDGTIIAEETNDPDCSIERVNGVRIDNGFGTSAAINNHEKQSLEVSDCRIILTNGVLRNLNDMEDVMAPMAASGVKHVVIIARAFEEAALKQCVKNIEVGFNLYPVNAPYVDQKEVMKDLAAITGARFFDVETMRLRDIKLSDVGGAVKVFAQRHTGIVTGLEDDDAKKRVHARIHELETQIKGEGSDFYKKMLEGRISQLKNGAAIIKVGAPTVTERNYKKDKVDDAVNAARAALQEGVVPGAGLAFMEIASTMPEDSLLKDALVAPYHQIMKNAEEVFEVEDWVQDPVKVCRIAFINACSVASTLATTAIAINETTERPRLVEEVKKPE